MCAASSASRLLRRDTLLLLLAFRLSVAAIESKSQELRSMKCRVRPNTKNDASCLLPSHASDAQQAAGAQQQQQSAEIQKVCENFGSTATYC